MNMTRLMIIILLALPSLALAEKKIAYVNPMQAISESKEVQASQMKMQSDFGEEQQRLQELRAEIGEIEQKLQKEDMTLSDKEKKRLRNDRESKMIEYRQLSQLLQKQVQGEQQEIFKRMQPKLMKAVQEIAEEQNYDVVLNIQAVVYADEEMDITRQVVQKLNQGE